jgi:hypothetical protein
MSVSLSSLISRLQSAVPARNNVPSVVQYEYAVKDAVGDFSKRAPIRKETTLSFVSGVATYSLPDDFLSLVAVISQGIYGDVILGDSGIVPVSASSLRERYSVAGLSLTVYPTPTYSASRTVQYAAKYALGEGDIYADLTDENAAVVLLKAQAIALDAQANVAAQEAWQYAIGDESVNKTGLVAALRAQAQEFESKYAAATAGTSGKRAYMSRARYDGSYEC